MDAEQVTRGECSARHPHEPAIPPAMDAEGRCLICLMLIERRKLEIALGEAHDENNRLRLAADGAEAVTEEWLRQVYEQIPGTIGFNFFNETPFRVSIHHPENGKVSKVAVATRAHVRALVAALGVPLTDPTGDKS